MTLGMSQGTGGKAVGREVPLVPARRPRRLRLVPVLVPGLGLVPVPGLGQVSAPVPLCLLERAPQGSPRRPVLLVAGLLVGEPPRSLCAMPVRPSLTPPTSTEITTSPTGTDST
jgi:hypothetical protein